MKEVTALIVHPHWAELRTFAYASDHILLRWLNEVVEGDIEGVFPNTPLVDFPWHAYCNENGKGLNLPANLSATKLAMLAGWRMGADTLLGSVIFFGNPTTGDPAGEANVPPDLIQLGRDRGVFARDARDEGVRLFENGENN